MKRIPFLHVLLLALALGGIGYLVAASVRSAPAGPVVNAYGEIVLAPEIDQSTCTWWYHLGEESTAIMNLGPLLESGSGYTVRRWTIAVRMQDGPEPLTCVQGILDANASDPIGVYGAGFDMQLRPAGDLVWGDVTHSSMIQAYENGLP